MDGSVTRAGRAAPLLTLDRGNATLDCSVEGRRRVRLDPADTGGLARMVAELRPAAAVGCTVVPRGLERVEAVLAAAWVPLWVAGRDLRCPLRLRYRLPRQLGADRWLAALAAHRDHGAAVVVDAGSATTVDAVTADGVLLGGVIAPGLQGHAAGLAERAPALPPARPAALPELVPDHTQAAVDAGVVLGFCGALERLVEEVRAAAGLPDAAVVVTGGDAETYLRHDRLGAVNVPDLVHRGLRMLWTES